MTTQFLLAIAAIAAPVSTASPAGPEPTVSANGKYCLRVEASTGRRVETVECMTRQQWAEQGVDLDKEWAEDGVILHG